MAAEDLRGVDLTGEAPARLPEPVVRVGCVGKRGWLARLTVTDPYRRYPDRVFVDGGLTQGPGRREWRIDTPALADGVLEAGSFTRRGETRTALRVAAGRVVDVAAARGENGMVAQVCAWAGIPTNEWDVRDDVATRALAAYPLFGSLPQRAWGARLRHTMARLLRRQGVTAPRVWRGVVVPTEACAWIDTRDRLGDALGALEQLGVSPRRDRLPALLEALLEPSRTPSGADYARVPLGGTLTRLDLPAPWSSRVWRGDVAEAWEALAARGLIPMDWADGAASFFHVSGLQAVPPRACDAALLAMDPAGLLAATAIGQELGLAPGGVAWAAVTDAEPALTPLATPVEVLDLGYRFFRADRGPQPMLVVGVPRSALRAAPYDLDALENQED